MPSPLRIAVAQPKSISGELELTVRQHTRAVRSAGARVVLFPELSLTGYELDAPAVALDDPLLAPLVEACGSTGTLALVGAPVSDGAALSGAAADADGRAEHLAVVAVDGDGARVVYRKMNLGEAEAVRFAPGPEPVALDVDGWRLGLAVCKDIGVPEHAAATAALGIDAYLAGVLEHAAAAGVTDERGHRIATTHGIWVAIASYAGSTGGGYDDAAGRSTVWRPDGAVVSRAGTGAGSLVCATLT